MSLIPVFSPRLVAPPGGGGITQQGAAQTIIGDGNIDIGTAGNDRLVVGLSFGELANAGALSFTVDGKAATVHEEAHDGFSLPCTLWSIHEAQLDASAGTVAFAESGGDDGQANHILLFHGVASNTPGAGRSNSVSLGSGTTLDITGINTDADDLLVTGVCWSHATATTAWSNIVGLVEQSDGAASGFGTGSTAVRIGSALSSATATATASASAFARLGVWAAWAAA